MSSFVTRKLACLSLIAAIFASSAVASELPTVNLPPQLRQKNWVGPNGSGSCVHATVVMLFRWAGLYDMAEFWRKTYADGEYDTELARRLDAAHIRFAWIDNGNPAFLDWACATRRGAGIGIRLPGGGYHFVMVVHCDSKYIAIIDNNRPSVVSWYDRNSYIDYWRSAGGWAVAIISGSPAPPLPERKR